MNRLFVTICALMLFPRGAGAESIRELFARVPRSVMPLLDRSARLDLMDLYGSALPAKCENMFGGQTQMTALTEHTVTLATTAVGQWQLVLIEQPADTLLMTLYTLNANGKSTEVTFYDTQWRERTETIVKTPSFNDFWCPPIGADENRLRVCRNTLSNAPVTAEWDDETKRLTFRISTDGIDAGIREEAAKCLCPVEMEWKMRNGKYGFS